MSTTTQVPSTLNATDRCDRCGAQAYVKVALPAGGTLLFCGHHFRDHEKPLRDSGAIVFDETSRLDQRPAVVAEEE